jgi:hypothetical protein
MEQINQRTKNYVEHYEKVDPRKIYSLTELLELSELELLNLMPQNQCVDEYSDKHGFNITKHIVGFGIYKIIDGTWRIGYYENHRDKKQSEQYKLFEISYVNDLKIGLVDLFLMVQNRSIEYFNGVKSGRIKLNLSESWDNREELGLSK